jgi:hypothetical protein
MSAKYISHFVDGYATNVQKNLKYSDTLLLSFLSNCLLATERHIHKFLHETHPYIYKEKQLHMYRQPLWIEYFKAGLLAGMHSAGRMIGHLDQGFP